MLKRKEEEKRRRRRKGETYEMKRN